MHGSVSPGNPLNPPKPAGIMGKIPHILRHDADGSWSFAAGWLMGGLTRLWRAAPRRRYENGGTSSLRSAVSLNLRVLLEDEIYALFLGSKSHTFCNSPKGFRLYSPTGLHRNWALSTLQVQGPCLT